MRRAMCALSLYLLATAPCVGKEPNRIGCGQLARPSQSVLKLSYTISIAYVTFSYELCAPDRLGGSAQLLILQQQWTGKKYVAEPSKVVSIDNANYEQLVSLLRPALKFNVDDFDPAIDGSTTCLEVWRSYYLKVCRGNIDVQAEARGLSGMLALQRRLWGWEANDAGSSGRGA